ncbi:hypothetical protein [Yinghuangia seranimata]|uniref:hypothetical protein n=1 Tax=Yinghuangia seranimata TaxID=408067 RepID=UPI00248C2AEB|nr:hypothetical protein [Yinghuangia seranimata]MDI2128259.1 hypothetical protein [Yinghuangia seranimata]
MTRPGRELAPREAPGCGGAGAAPEVGPAGVVPGVGGGFAAPGASGGYDAPDVPVLSVDDARAAGYRLLRGFFDAAGAASSLGAVELQAGPCDDEGTPHPWREGYYNLWAAGAFAAPRGDPRTAFTRMYEHAVGCGFAVTGYANPDAAPAGNGPFDAWLLMGAIPVEHGHTFRVFSGRPQTRVEVWITSSCRRAVRRTEERRPFSLPGLLPVLPPSAPVWPSAPPPPPAHTLVRAKRTGDCTTSATTAPQPRAVRDVLG